MKEWLLVEESPIVFLFLRDIIQRLQLEICRLKLLGKDAVPDELTNIGIVLGTRFNPSCMILLCQFFALC